MATDNVGWSNFTNGVGTEARQRTPQANPNDALANKETFLQLLVAQIRYQNPLAPQDGGQFLSQLAQFSALEQSMAIRKDLGALLASVERIEMTFAASDSGTEGVS